MYIYELPFDIDKELCRLLDNDDLWKELAGSHMRYSAFEINEIEQTARRQALSPTSQLLTRWGQLNHRVEELFILLYRMKHVPAMTCIKPLVSERYHRLLSRNGVRDRPTASVDENGNRPAPGSQSSVPLIVKLIAQGQETTNRNVNDDSPCIYESSSVDNTTSTDHEHSRESTYDDDFIREHVSAIPMLKYEDLTKATNNWSESNLLGRGGFGQVFKGEWKLLPVAVKRLRDKDGKNRELIRELCLNQYRHDNILPLYGYSIGGPEACLVYQLMAGGSLEQRLRCKTQHPPLTWSQRHRIAHGVARGLLFLHTMTGTPLIHGDIKPANILLDPCTMPKIGDFGLARKGPYGEERTHLKVSRVNGTRPYLPNEYLSSHHLSPAVDVFSFGVVLFELASALPAIDKTRNPPLLTDYLHNCAKNKIDYANLEDRILVVNQASNPELCRQFVSLGLRCTEDERHSRPTMMQICTKLDSLAHYVKSEGYYIENVKM